MEISKLIFSKETKEKMDKELNAFEKQKLLLERVKEASENGKLDTCKTRKEVARVVGYTADREQAGYVWVCNMVRSGKLEERVVGVGKNGSLEYEYKFIENPVKHTPKKVEEDRLSKRQMGEKRWQILVECARSGKLARCKTRKDVAKLVGYKDNEMSSGYSWVMNMITRKHLVCEEIGIGKTGAMEYNFSIGEQPNYRLGKGNGKKRKPDTIEEIAKTVDPVILDSSTITSSNVVVSYGKLRIEFNDTNANTMKDIIITLIDKVKGE